MSTDALSFGEVLLEELALIRKRHWHLHGPPSFPDLSDIRVQDTSPPPQNSPQSVAHQQAHEMELSGLALSGGGIRSATFNLGILQALAEIGILKEFDYLSTVSGGGYIGSWLAAWIKREGSDLQNVERQLAPSRVTNSQAYRHEVPDNQVREEEPEPIAHLRAYSNYLAPRPSLVYRDSWVLGAIYLRNFLLNQLILLPFAAIVLLFARLLLAFFYEDEWPWGGTRDDGATLGLILLAGTQFISGFSIWQLRGNRVRLRAERRPILFGPWMARCLILLPLIVAAVLLARVFIIPEHQPIEWPRLPLVIEDKLRYAVGKVLGQDTASAIPSIILVYTLVQVAVPLLFVVDTLLSPVRARLFNQRLHWNHETTLKLLSWPIASAVGGVVGGGLLFALGEFIHSGIGYSDEGVALSVLLAPPLILVIFILVNFVQTGFLGPALGEEMREWWASICAGLMRCITVWVVLFAVALFGGWVILKMGPWFQALFGASWLTAVVTGLIADRSSPVGSRDNWRHLARRGAPYVVIVGVLAFISWLVAVAVNNPSPWSAELDQYWLGMARIDKAWVDTVILVCFWVVLVMSLVLGINAFSLHATYRNRLVRCYLGASRSKDLRSATPALGVPTAVPRPFRQPDPITGFDPRDDLELATLEVGWRDPNDVDLVYWGPLLVVNTALNLVLGEELSWQERMADAFVLTPTHCGSRLTGYRRMPKKHSFTLGTAVTISGAAVSPNMGYHSRRALGVLLTIFNVRLGRWLRNPLYPGWVPSSPRSAMNYLLHEMFGLTHSRSRFVYISDGGHFDNLGVFELVRRRCRFIVASDGAADPRMEFADLANLVRKCRTDLGVRIEIELKALRTVDKERFAQSHRLAARWITSADLRVHGEERFSLSHVAIGTIHYEDVDPTVAPGILLYIKSSLTGDEPADVFQYAEAHSEFPHQTTTDQFFNESQFESYRALGYHIGAEVFRSV